MPTELPTDPSIISTGARSNDYHASLESAIAEREAYLARLHGHKHVLPIVAVGLLLLIAIPAITLALHLPPGTELQKLQAWLLRFRSYPVVAVALGISAAFVLFFLVRITLRETAVHADIELLQARQRIATALTAAPQLTEAAGSFSYFDSLVRINVDNLAEYYTLVKVHTNNSFRASLLAGLIGFGLILIGVIAGFGGESAATPAKLAAFSGVITEFISGVFFYLYNRTVRQLKEYHDSLLAVQNILLALKLVNDTSDATAKRDITAQMCRSLLTRASAPAASEPIRPTPKRTKPKVLADRGSV